jgi:hypothetical protein
VPANRGEQDLGARREDHLAGVGVNVVDWADQPPQPAGIFMHPNRADPRQGHRASVSPTNPDASPAGPAVGLVAQPEAVATAPLALSPREAGPALPFAVLGPGVGGQRPAEVDGGLLEHLCGDLVPPLQAQHMLGDCAISGNDEHPACVLGLLPTIECVDQVEPRPRHLDL